MKDGLITIGEALVDMIPINSEHTVYQKSPGGAPANVAVGAARLGVSSTFIGKLGSDVLGLFLKETLEKNGVQTGSLILTDSCRTGLVFVGLDQQGERHFQFYLEKSADQFLEEAEIKEELFKEHKIFHFGTLSLLHDPVRAATKRALFYAKKHNMMVTFDPNIRLSIWKDEEALKNTIWTVLKDVDVLKLSEEELLFLSGSTEIEIIAKWMEEFKLSLVFLTMGAEGCIVFTPSQSCAVEALIVEPVDTTGAGDAFVAGITYCLNQTEKCVSSLSLEEAVEIARFATKLGGLAVSRKGAMTALPTLKEVKKIK